MYIVYKSINVKNEIRNLKDDKQPPKVNNEGQLRWLGPEKGVIGEKHQMIIKETIINLNHDKTSQELRMLSNVTLTLNWQLTVIFANSGSLFIKCICPCPCH